MKIVKIDLSNVIENSKDITLENFLNSNVIDILKERCIENRLHSKLDIMFLYKDLYKIRHTLRNTFFSEFITFIYKYTSRAFYFYKHNIETMLFNIDDNYAKVDDDSYVSCLQFSTPLILINSNYYSNIWKQLYRSLIMIHSSINDTLCIDYNLEEKNFFNINFNNQNRYITAEIEYYLGLEPNSVIGIKVDNSFSTILD